jgi:urease accessory protein
MRTKSYRFILQCFSLVGAAAMSGQTMAHTGAGIHDSASFVAGLVHPLIGVDHLAAMLAVGLWSALVSRHVGMQMIWSPLAFANMLLMGALLGMNGVTTGLSEPLIATSLLALGLLVLTRLQLPAVLGSGLVGGFALFHGLAHGQELAHSAQAFEALAGMLSTTLMLHATGLGLGLLLRTRSVWLARLAGASVAALGSILLVQLS